MTYARMNERQVINEYWGVRGINKSIQVFNRVRIMNTLLNTRDICKV